MPDHAFVHLHPVMGPGDLADRIIERLDPDVIRVESENAALFPGWDTDLEFRSYAAAASQAASTARIWSSVG